MVVDVAPLLLLALGNDDAAVAAADADAAADDKDAAFGTAEAPA